MWALLQALRLFYDVLSFLILARVLSSWFVRNPYNRLYQILLQLTEPMLAPCRMLLSRFQQNLGVDFSPILALLFLNIIYRILYTIIYRMAM